MVSVLTNAISMAGVVAVLLVVVGAIASAVAAVAAVAVATVAVVVVVGGGGRLILTDDAACSSLETGSCSISLCLNSGCEIVINIISRSDSVSCCENLDTAAHDGGGAGEVNQNVGLDVIGGLDTVRGVSSRSGNNLDSATLGILEGVNTTVLVLLTKRSPLIAHVSALLCSAAVLASLVQRSRRAAANVENSTVFGEDELPCFSSFGLSSSVPLHGGSLSRSLSELEKELNFGSRVSRCISGTSSNSSNRSLCLDLDGSSIALSEFSLFRGATSVLDLGRGVLLVGGEPLGLVGGGCAVGTGPGVVAGAGLVSMGVVAAVLVAVAVVVLVVVVAVSGGAGGGSSGDKGGNEGLHLRQIIFLRKDKEYAIYIIFITEI